MEQLLESDSMRARIQAYKTEVPAGGFISVTQTTTSTGKGTFITAPDGKTRPYTVADARQEETRKNATMLRYTQMVSGYAETARNTLTQALNEAAADGWEVVK
ncbi:MAG: hypothetical protein WKG07_28570 [Hymenobacter sp.]